MAFLEPVNQATHLNSRPSAFSARASFSATLIADLEAVLVRSLATPQMPCAATTQATDSAAAQAGDSADSTRKPQDLRREAHGQHARDAEARGQPAADQVGDDARRLVEQEQEGQREGRIAELEEVQQHQHAQRAVGQGEAPVGGRDDGVVAGAGRHQMPASRMWQARSTMRQA